MMSGLAIGMMKATEYLYSPANCDTKIFCHRRTDQLTTRYYFHMFNTKNESLADYIFYISKINVKNKKCAILAHLYSEVILIEK